MYKGQGRNQRELMTHAYSKFSLKSEKIEKVSILFTQALRILEVLKNRVWNKVKGVHFYLPGTFSVASVDGKVTTNLKDPVRLFICTRIQKGGNISK